MHRSLHTAASFVISCGTVTLDLRHSKVLLIHCPKTGENMLPKGRKDIREALEETALRETLEETGYKAVLLPLRIPTQATRPNSHGRPGEYVTEPVAVTERDKDGVKKIIFWFAATADSSRPKNVGDHEQENEDFEAVWTLFDCVHEKLSYKDDQEVAKFVLDNLPSEAVPATTLEGTS